MPRHGIDVGAGSHFQALPVGGADGSRSCAIVRLPIAGASACQRESQVRVAVYESRHHHAAGGVDLRGRPRLRQVLHSPGGAHFLQNSIGDQQGAVLNDP